MRTPLQHLADLLLGESVEDWIAARREAGRSWRSIAVDLRDATDGRIDASGQTLLTWAKQPNGTAA